MAFKVKDLMINYLPTQAQGAQALPPCLDPPNTCGCTHCSLCTQVCTEGCSACTQCTQCTNCTHCTHCTNCTACTQCTHCTGCTHRVASCIFATCAAQTCNFGSACTPFASLAQTPAGEASSLSALKQQLAAQLAEVERQEKAAEEELRPKTVAEVDELQKKLQDAIDELKTRRAELEQKEKKEKGK